MSERERERGRVSERERVSESTDVNFLSGFMSQF